MIDFQYLHTGVYGLANAHKAGTMAGHLGPPSQLTTSLEKISATSPTKCFEASKAKSSE